MNKKSMQRNVLKLREIYIIFRPEYHHSLKCSSPTFVNIKHPFNLFRLRATYISRASIEMMIMNTKGSLILCLKWLKWIFKHFHRWKFTPTLKGGWFFVPFFVGEGKRSRKTLRFNLGSILRSFDKLFTQK